MALFNNDNEKELLNIFQTESEEILERLFGYLYSLETTPANKEIIANTYRDLHSLKGAVRMIGFNNIQTILHKTEDIFDLVNQGKYSLNTEIIKKIIKIFDIVSRFLQESVKNQREIIDDEYTAAISGIEYILDIELPESQKHESIIEQTANTAVNDTLTDLTSKSEEINTIFNNCFNIIDSITPEEETTDIIILEEEIQKIYEVFKNTDLYEIKTSLENIITKLDFVRNATNTLTISEILDIRNEMSSAAAKYTTSCISTESGGLSFFDVAEKINMLQGGGIYAKEIKEDILKLKEGIDNNTTLEVINMIIEILDFINENSVQPEEQILLTLKNGIEYCASPNENVDSELIVQQLEIMKQLLELSYKKDTELSDAKISTQTAISTKASTSEIKTLHVNAQKLDLLVNQLGELIITKIKTEKNLEKVEAIKTANENCQKDLIKTSNYLRYYNRKYLQTLNTDQYTGTFIKQVFALLSDITQNVSKTIYDLNSLYRTSKEDDMKIRLIIDEMESMVKNIRVLPISTVFNSFARMVRDIASEKGKDIDFEIEGKETCADKKIIEEIKTPLIHILRNAIDHGIETKDERLASGKSPTGRILLSAKQDENKVIIDVIDDGRGFNIEKIKDKAVAKGFLTKDDIASMNDEAIMNIIFWPGFTTGDSITSVSGRGIGLDVVKTKISQLNGKVKVISEFGKGSCVHIEIPVTLATLRVFLVKISEQTFAIPIQFITTFVLKKQDEINTNNGQRSILYNNNVIPLYYLSDILQLETKPRSDKETILIIESDEQTIGLVVDKLLGDQDILQKKLSPPLYKVKNIAGITNLASGELCLILNMQDILHYDFNKAMITNSVSTPAMLTNDILSYKRILTVDDSITTRTMLKNILMNAGYTADVVSDAEEALVKLKLNHYDLIISDLNMPKINGVDFVRMLKNDEMFADIPIIVISSLTEREANKMLDNLKIDYYMSKENFNQAEFSREIKNILTKYHS